MPAGRGSSCEDCYWKNLSQKRAKISSESFTSLKIRELYLEFTDWSIRVIGPHKTAISYKKHLPFFQEADVRWGDFPDYSELLKSFGAEGLRKAQTPMKWLQFKGIICVDLALKEDDSALRRVEALLSRFGPGQERDILDGFKSYLLGRKSQGKITNRTLVFSMTAASGLLNVTRQMSSVVVSQLSVIRYLSQTPGQRASLASFIGYLNKEHNFSLLLPKASRSFDKRYLIEVELIALIQQSKRTVEVMNRWMVLGLAYFHGLPLTAGASVNDQDIQHETDGGLTILWSGQRYFLPNLLTVDSCLNQTGSN
ncbi:MAG: hypothetical protein U0998_05085 [Moraxellaceae bacterium]|nr:hypothetical protein [Moraxellaceae bacterium]